MIIKPQGPQVAISTANSMSNASLVYIVNIGAAATCNLTYANAEVYANVTVTNTYPTIIQKAATDLVAGTSSMYAVPVAYKGS